MADYFTNQYVPKRLIREWSDESGNVFWYSPLGKKTKEGKPGAFFHDKITGLAEDELEYIEMLGEERESFCFLSRCMRFNELKDEDPRERSAILFSYMCTPSYQMYSEGLDGSLVNLKGSKSGSNGIRSGSYISRILQIINSVELSLMDLACDVVYPVA